MGKDKQKRADTATESGRGCMWVVREGYWAAPEIPWQSYLFSNCDNGAQKGKEKETMWAQRTLCIFVYTWTTKRLNVRSVCTAQDTAKIQ